VHYAHTVTTIHERYIRINLIGKIQVSKPSVTSASELLLDFHAPFAVKKKKKLNYYARICMADFEVHINELFFHDKMPPKATEMANYFQSNRTP
jgi:hypothetical protein